MRRRPQSKSPLKQPEMSKRPKSGATGDLEESSFDQDSLDQNNASQVKPLLDTSITEEVDSTNKIKMFSPRAQAGRSNYLVGGITLAFGLILIFLKLTHGKFSDTYPKEK
mmetsp:Transcript_44363/g.106889  ORF Transcript_44363/g.106889 Transcript_44363/m.106889 type:complete len:110 (+) Transcript_44363:73-402(+)